MEVRCNVLRCRVDPAEGFEVIQVAVVQTRGDVTGRLFDDLEIQPHADVVELLGDEVDAIEINPADLRIDVYRAQGPGGQSVNTTDSAVRVTHLPTGIVAQCQDEKSQHKNKDKAFKVLRSRLYDMELAKKQEEDAAKRNSQVSSGDRSAKIRTYNYPQGRVTDHRINLTLYDLQNIINGDLQKIIDELMLVHNTEKLKEASETF